MRLRLLRPDDAEALADLEARNRRHLLSGAPARGDDWVTRSGQRAAIARLLAQHELGETLPMGIVLDEEGREPGRLVGRITLNQILRGPAQWASVGYWVDEAESGRGIATHALRLMIDVAFEGLGLHRLEAGVALGNEASARVLLACGFHEYGYAPQMLRLGIAGEGWADCRLFQLIDPRTDRGRGTVAAGGAADAIATPSSPGEPGAGRTAASEVTEDDLLFDLADAIAGVARLMQVAATERVDVEALTGTEITVLRWVHRHPGTTSGETARATGLRRSNMSAALRGLVTKGMVVRENDARDSRLVHLRLTEIAERNSLLIRRHWAAALRERLPALDGQDRVALARAVELLTEWEGPAPR